MSDQPAHGQRAEADVVWTKRTALVEVEYITRVLGGTVPSANDWMVAADRIAGVTATAAHLLKDERLGDIR